MPGIAMPGGTVAVITIARRGEIIKVPVQDGSSSRVPSLIGYLPLEFPGRAICRSPLRVVISPSDGRANAETTMRTGDRRGPR